MEILRIEYCHRKPSTPKNGSVLLNIIIEETKDIADKIVKNLTFDALLTHLVEVRNLE